MKSHPCKYCGKETTNFKYCCKKCAGFARKGIPRSEELKQKVSKTLKKTYTDNPELIESMSTHRKGKTPWNKGLTKETDSRLAAIGESIKIAKQNNPAWNKGLTKEVDVRVKINAKHISETLKGHTVSEETRQKISNANKGKIISEYQRNRISEAISGDNNPMKRPEIKEKHLEACRTTEYRARASAAMKEHNPMKGRDCSGENNSNWKGGKEASIQRKLDAGWVPYTENPKCALFLGIHIAERILSNYFDDITRMPYGNPGYDYICKRGYKIDVKSSTMCKDHWNFSIKRNKIADYFLCIAFDNRESLTPIHLWLIPGSIINQKSSINVYSKEWSLSKWKQYEKSLDKVMECCEKLKE